jgi:hypothetical protein
VSPTREIRLDCAAFLDSSQGTALPYPRADVRAIAERFLSVAYDELGTAPQALDGDGLTEILTQRLPAHFGKRDPLAEAVEDVLDAYLAFLVEHAVVAHSFEQRRALLEHAAAFRRVVATGELAGRAPARKVAPFVHRAEKTGRNAPCPCGSGKKFKQCCMALGR